MLQKRIESFSLLNYQLLNEILYISLILQFK